MAGLLRKFKVHGAFGLKSKAKRKEKSAVCNNRCFIKVAKVRGKRRYLVLENR